MKPRKIPGRIVLYPRDIEIITGLSRRSCQRLMQKIRIAKGKGRHEFVTIADFCQICGISEDAVKEYIWD